MKRKILYVMHVDWHWIKQRPQYIAEFLSQKYNITVLYCFNKQRSVLSKNKHNNFKIFPFIRMPFRRKNKIIYFINKILLKIYFFVTIIVVDPDYIWITHPEIYDYIPCDVKNKIIYDCMDDVIEMESDLRYRQRLMELEKKLVKKSSVTFVSSENLLKKLEARGGCKKKISLLRNGFNGDEIKVENYNNNVSNLKLYKVGYIGTVSSWFDFDSIMFSLKNLDNIEYHVIGPIDVDISKFSLEKIKFYSVVNHNELYSYIKDFDCMIMPFKVNEIIQSVDPVKFYEYINFNKPIISVFYEEIKRFLPYVNFYSDEKELVNVLQQMVSHGFQNKYTKEQRLEFLSENNWNKRAGKIIEVLGELK